MMYKIELAKESRADFLTRFKENAIRRIN